MALTKWSRRWRVTAIGLLVFGGARPLDAAPTAHEESAVVAADGSGQFRSLQAAIAAAPTARRDQRWIIHVKPGVYKERIYVQREKRFLAIVGEDPEKTIITFDLHANLPGPDGKPIGTFRTATAVIDADDFTAENLGFENPAGLQGQALALRVDGDRAAFRNCRLVGWQDTVLLNRGRHYFEDSFISGHVDFIFGGATAFFERCRIQARRDGYITAASTPEEQRHGFVFSHCSIGGESPEVRTWLGRPWRSYASVIFLNTEMSEVVRPAGWHNWDQPNREKTTRYAEYASTGPGANPGARVPWARPIAAEEAAVLTARSILAGHDGWDPQAEGPVGAAAKPPADRPSIDLPACPPPARFRANLEYARVGSDRLLLDACLPAGKGPFPAALLVHGGGWTSGDKTRAALTLVRRLTEAGIAWISVDYRLAPQHRYPAPVEDVEAAIRWTKKNASRFEVDAARLALVGESAGGHLVAMAAVRMKEDTRVAAVVPLFAPLDLEADTERRGGLSASTRALFGRTEADEATRATLRDASPIRQVRSGLPPFLLVHGTADMSVPYEQSRRMQEALRAAGVPCELITVPDGTHGTRGWDPLLPTYREQVVTWMAAQLKSRGRP